MWCVLVLVIVLILLCNKKESFSGDGYITNPGPRMENFSILTGDFQSLLDKETHGLLYEKESRKINIKDIESGDIEVERILKKHNKLDENIFKLPHVRNLYSFDRFELPGRLKV